MMGVLYRFPKLTYVIIGLITCLILFTPVRLTWRLLGEYNQKKIGIKKLAHEKLMLSSTGRRKDFISRNEEGANFIFEALSVASKNNNVLITQVAPSTSFDVESAIVMGEQITMEGSFVNLLKTLDEIKAVLFPVKIASVKYERVENNKQVKLFVHVTFQSLKIKEQ